MAKNLYCDLDQFKRRFAGDPTLEAGDAADIELVMEAAARRIDQFTRRSYFDETATRVLDGEGRSWQWIPDLLAETTIKLDEDGDRTFEMTLVAGTDYYLKRRGYRDEDALPATVLELDDVNGQRSTLLARKRLIELVGRWGFTEDVFRVIPVATITDATTTAMATDVDGDIVIGQTFKIEAEQVYVNGGTASPWTVERGVNGTAAAAHAGVAMDQYIWTPEVREAALIIAGRMWKRRETSYANVFANPVVGQFETFRRDDPDVAMLLEPLIRGDALV